ncbi:hypothetical protein OGAPHI_003694 [Ogataea philodendri]|uniref:Uncharacterized protein n=1 Tax=Ogataea philodendri TaxID=1378263 RepID=A0A9P8T426_9ASCO|nr:uncharacterized protein OGAPHI_003694 [Ogataea philodendri]KAH3665508.1 hypothetical protein OGAPHI_003694 [Ogataea philodendri]
MVGQNVLKCGSVYLKTITRNRRKIPGFKDWLDEFFNISDTRVCKSLILFMRKSVGEINRMYAVLFKFKVLVDISESFQLNRVDDPLYGTSLDINSSTFSLSCLIQLYMILFQRGLMAESKNLESIKISEHRPFHSFRFEHWFIPERASIRSIT